MTSPFIRAILATSRRAAERHHTSRTTRPANDNPDRIFDTCGWPGGYF